MSNKQAIEIIEKMIDDFNETERRWLYLSDNETYARDVLIETKYKRQSLPDTDEWISVEEGLPDDSYWNVLWYVRELNDLWMSYFIDVIHYNMHLKMWMKDFIEYNVTHWMPLPNIPNE